MDQRTNGRQWNLLGTFSFSDTVSQGITLSADPDKTVIVDAIRFVPAPESALIEQQAYFHVDHLNTPQAMTDSSMNLVWKADQEPFGKTTLTTMAVENPLRFPGQYADTETGLFQNWWRDYDPSLGRYIESDPIGLRGGTSTYSYVHGSPLTGVDPRGLIKWKGHVTSYSASLIVGAAYFHFVLQSECKDNKMYFVEVTAGGPTVGFSVDELILGGTYGEITLEDKNDYLDPNVFDGGAVFGGAGFAFGSKGKGVSGFILGGAATPDMKLGGQAGLDLSLTGGAGVSTLDHATPAPCCNK